ncbi:MAG TPA: hypothetical protein VIJ17_07355, partial [Pseudolabrys sp.]
QSRLTIGQFVRSQPSQEASFSFISSLLVPVDDIQLGASFRNVSEPLVVGRSVPSKFACTGDDAYGR